MAVRKKARRSVVAKKTGFESLGHAKADIKMVEIDNPHYSAAHAGMPGNPKTTTAALNVGESPITWLADRGVLEGHHVMAANKFRRLWEKLGGAGAGSFDYSREPVDGGGARESIIDAQIDAGRTLADCESVIGKRHYRIIQMVACEGMKISDFSKTQREKTTNSDYLRNALEDLADHWGMRTRRASV